MDYLRGEQLSLIAEEDSGCDYCDWSIDTSPPPSPPLSQKSIEEIRAHFVRSLNGGQNKNPPSVDSALHDGGQTKTRIITMEGNGGQADKIDGGQTKKRLDPVGSPDHGSETRHSSIFDRSRGDDGTWIEKQNRKSGVFEYLRWRELDGTKRAKYLGKLIA